MEDGFVCMFFLYESVFVSLAVSYSKLLIIVF